MNDREIIYVYDALCGWCYGFSSVIRKLFEAYGDQIPFTVLSGGMILGEREGPIGRMSAFLEQAIPRVEETTGVRFGQVYIDEILREGSYRASSFMPSIGLTLFKNFQPEKAVLFAHDLQRAHYLEGKSLNEPETYQELAEKFGLPGVSFVQGMGSPEAVTLTQQEFARVRHLGIEGFPALLYREGEKYYMLSHGYRPFDQVKVLLEQVLRKEEE